MRYQNLKTFTLLIITFVFLFSCNKADLFEATSETNETPEPANHSFKLTEEEAINNLQTFLNELDQPLDGSVSKRSKPVRIIEDVQVIGKNAKMGGAINNNNKSNLRSLLSTAQTDTILYLINFEDTGGFAIVSADKRSNKIYAIVDEGALDANDIDEVDNPGFNMFLRNAIVTEIAETSSSDNYDLAYENRGSDVPVRSTRMVKPLLKTKWGQDSPYNTFCPNQTTGCVITAIAQIFSYYQPINSVSFYDDFYNINRSSNLTWSKIISDCQNANIYGVLTSSSAPQSSQQVAHLMRYIGIGVKAYYDPAGETIANSSIAISWLRKNGFSTSIASQTYNFEIAYDALSKGDLVYMSGSSGGDVGHAWVGDGGIESLSTGRGSGSSVIYNNYLHCNWGWNGSCDGYYLDFVLSNGAPYSESIDRPGSINTNYNSAKRMTIMKR